MTEDAKEAWCRVRYLADPRCVRCADGPGGPTDKKKYAIRDIRASSHLESGESAWKAEVLPLHQWRLFRAQHRWVRSDESSHRSNMFHKYRTKGKPHCNSFTSTGTTVSSLRIAAYALCAATVPARAPAVSKQRERPAIAVLATTAAAGATTRRCAVRDDEPVAARASRLDASP